MGNFYCKRLLDSFNIDKVLRISLVHYNSKSELDSFFYLLRTFKKNPHNLVEYIQYKYDLSETVKDSFNHLQIDSYYENKRYRAFSLINVKNFTIIRLSTPFGNNMKKGPLFDIIKKNQSFVHQDSEYSFIHIDDVTNAIKHIIQNKILGYYNLTANESCSIKSIITNNKI